VIRVLRVGAVALAAVSTACLVASTALRPVGAGVLVGLAWPVSYILVGLLLTVRRPTLLTGWLFAAIGFLVTSGGISDVLTVEGVAGRTSDPTWWGTVAIWYGEWYWLLLITVPLVFLPLLFPTGRAISPAWRRIVLSLAIVIGGIVTLAALQEHLDAPDATTSIPNPIGIRGLSDVEMEGSLLGGVVLLLLVAALITAFVGLVARFRRSTTVERQQLKWFTSATATLIIGFVLQGLLEGPLGGRLPVVDPLLFTLVPVAAGVAIMRYRLYAIDRLISRTVTYALVTALLVGVYLGAITIMSAALGSIGGQSPLAVATATLAAAALFRPARSRIQDQVDRRFNRARYDVERTLDGFRERMRSDVDLDRLGADLVSVADETLQPARTMLWMLPMEQSS
jgi:hypothetical protein